MIDLNNRISTALVVLGFHRSGTSAFAGALTKSGLAAPKTLIPSVAGENDKGFWESALLSRFNDDYLTSRGYAWDQFWSNSLDLGILMTHTQAELDSLCELILSEFGTTSQTIVLKDPRLCLVLPVWQAALERLDISPVYLFALRNPSESAQSLALRNEIPLEQSLLLWLHYVLNAEKMTRGAKRVFIEYADLLSNPVETVEKILMELELPVDLSTSSCAEVRQFVDKGLWRHKANPVDGVQKGWVYNEVYRSIVSLGSTKSLQELDHSYAQFGAILTDVASLISVRERLISDLSTRVDSATSRLAVQSSELQALRDEADALKACVQTHKAKADLLISHQQLFENSWLGSCATFIQRMSHRVLSNSMAARAYLKLKKIDNANDRLREMKVLQDSGLFDSAYYLEVNPGIKWMMTHPLLHYITVGHRLNYNPNSNFEECAYTKGVSQFSEGSGLFHYVKKHSKN
ncbi:sulfotransferase family protein [Arenicella xantha]|uniref:Sulfotransferase family protein n=1 Tax=Arenicella xantha TaxID=644221 RepID=A0A395JN08_9GAMM|nr:hypothetical protein [Arenicella xantha]RBP50998.1 hypothetical protein DFR28_102415 [Arenicella xantha]